MKMIHNVACSILLFLASAIPSSAQNGWTYYPSSDFFPGAKTTHVVIDSNGKAWADTHWRFFTLEDWGWRIVNAPDYPSYPHYFFRTFDPSGNLWVGTPQGVSRFDGTAWKHFTDADVLPSEDGRSIAFGSGGDIWIGTDEYVSKISGDKIVSWNVPGYVTSLATAPDGSVWAGMLYKGIYRFNGREWVCMSSNYEEQWTTCMKIDRTGRVWCLSRNGVSYYEDGRWKYYPCGPFQTTVGGYLIEIAPDGSVWVLFGECLCIFDGTTWRDVNLPKVFNTIHTASMAFEASGAIWFGSEQGAYRFDPDYVAPPDPIPLRVSDYVVENFPKRNFYGILAFRNNELWYGTQSGLVRRDLSTGGEQLYSSAAGIPLNQYTEAEWKNNGIIDWKTAPNGDIWVAATYGIARFDGSSWTAYKELEGTPFDVSPGMYTRQLAIAPNGDAWVGTDRCIARFDGKSWKRFTSLPVNTINTIACAPNGDVWAGTYEGPARFDGTAWKPYSSADGIVLGPTTYSRSLCSRIVVGPDGRVWSAAGGTAGNMKTFMYDIMSLSCFDGTKWTNRGEYSHGISQLGVLKNGTVWAQMYPAMGPGTYLYLYDGTSWRDINTSVINVSYSSYGVKLMNTGPDDTFWGVCQGAVYHYEGSSWKRYGTEDGLAGAVNASVQFGPDGTPWVAASDGVCRMKNGSWETVAAIRSPNSDTITCLETDPRGVLWAGTDKGLSSFDGKEWSNLYFPGSVAALRIDADKRLWAGGNGLWKQTDGAWDRIGPDHGLAVSSDYRVRAMAITPTNDVFAAIYDSLSSPASPWKYISSNKGSWEVSPNGAGDIVSIVITPQGDYWCASPNRVYIFGNGRSLTLSPNVDFQGLYIRTLALDPDGGVIVGTDTGAALFTTVGDTPKLVTTYLKGKNVRSVTVDPKGKIWFGTDKGVHILDGVQWEYFTSAEGLTNDTVTATAFLANGTACIGTLGGITRLVPKSVGVESDQAVPLKISIRGNFPNPFNPSTTISFTLPRGGETALTVYNIAGQKVRTLISGFKAAGTHSAMWNGRDDAGRVMSSGVYIAHLRAGNAVSSRKMLLMK